MHGGKLSTPTKQACHRPPNRHLQRFVSLGGGQAERQGSSVVVGGREWEGEGQRRHAGEGRHNHAALAPVREEVFKMRGSTASTSVLFKYPAV